MRTLVDLFASPWAFPREMRRVFEDGAARWQSDDPLGPLLETLHAGIGAAAASGVGGVAARELSNKVHAYGQFRIGALRAARASVDIDPRDRPWMEEGWGYATAVEHRDDPAAVAAAMGDAPSAVTTVRNAGLGLAYAMASLASRDAIASPEAVGERVEAFLLAIQASVPPRHRRAAIENLGFAVRMLRPEMIDAVGAAARQADIEAPYWHGAGRGLCFAPKHLVGLPTEGGWPSLDRVIVEAPDAGRPHAVAGLAFGLTMVNVSDPEVVGRRLQVTRKVAYAEALPWIAQGMASALMVWRAVVGSDERGVDVAEDVLARFLAFPQPEGVAAPVRSFLANRPTTTREDSNLGDRFIYRPLETP